MKKETIAIIESIAVIESCANADNQFLSVVLKKEKMGSEKSFAKYIKEITSDENLVIEFEEIDDEYVNVIIS